MKPQILQPLHTGNVGIEGCSSGPKKGDFGLKWILKSKTISNSVERVTNFKTGNKGNL